MNSLLNALVGEARDVEMLDHLVIEADHVTSCEDIIKKMYVGNNPEWYSQFIGNLGAYIVEKTWQERLLGYF